MKKGSCKHRQQGQAMIFGLLFLAAVLMVLLSLFNKGQLIKNRVQLENAADATAYSQAKLSARSQNFTAYTNRAMIANEVSIGQMVALLSWANHYKNIGAFVQFPVYQFPVIPPAPTTYSNLLQLMLLPYQVMGGAVSAPTKVMVDKWPTVVSTFNSSLGVFQQLFGLSTLAAQFEMNINIVNGHQVGEQDNKMYTPPLGWYFMAQNYYLTYRGKSVDVSGLTSALSLFNSSDVSEGLVGDFLGGQSGQLENFINTNSPETSNSSRDDNDAVDSYKRYAAMVNNNRDDFTKDRHWELFPRVGVDPPALPIPLGVAVLWIDLDLEFGFGLKNDGGAAYVTKSALENDRDIEGLGWSAIDMTSLALDINIGVKINVEFCFIFGCETVELLDTTFPLSWGLPIAGATHQLVSDNRHAKKVLPDGWGSIGTKDGMYGGDPQDSSNEGPLDIVHLVTLGWAQTVLGTGVFGANMVQDVTDSYGGPPGFYSLGEHFQERGVGYEFTVALAKHLDDIATADNSGTFNIGGARNEGDWDEAGDAIKYTRFETTSRSRAEGRGLDEAAYQRLVWDSDRPMMTVSAAEVYFANPMQMNADGSPESASLFSPFWDARLREPSDISLFLATGEVDWQALFNTLPTDSVGIVNWLLDSVANAVVDESVDYVKAQIDSPFDMLLEPPLNTVATETKSYLGQATSAITTELRDL
tara:strand:+ start:19 stop:2115 length:2097 start_codon:yes stop_codon:yes gene_type:complete